MRLGLRTAPIAAALLSLGFAFGAAAQKLAQSGQVENLPPRPVEAAKLTGVPPYPVIVSQVHNAPGWRRSHAYSDASGPFTRVVNGPGWNEAAGTFNPRQPLYAYQLISTGSCVSAQSGGPTGAAAAIQDGSCTWKYLSNVDYVSLTGWAFDNTPWRPQTYFFGDNIVSDAPLRSYRLADPAGCDSAVAPAGTGRGMGATITLSDGCQWTYWADVIYTSGVSHIPTQTYHDNSQSKATQHLAANYQANLWNDREYVAGQNGESAPIILQAHFDYTPDGFPYSPEGIVIQPDTSFHLIVTTAPGESFRDTLTPAMPLAGYDPTKGVAIHNPINGDYAAGLELRDNLIDLIGLQIKSDYRPAVGGGETHGGNGVTIQNSIVDGGASSNTAAVQLDASSIVANSLILARGSLGVVEGYPGIIVYSTLINPGRAANSIAVASGGPWIFNGAVVSNSAVFGFAHAAASTGTMNWRGGSNLTDAPAGDAGSGTWTDPRVAITVTALPGTAYGTAATGVFESYPGDYRLAASSPLRGKGGAYGPFKRCEAKHPDCPGMIYNFDSPDIIGSHRPQAGRYDVGAWQSTLQ